MILTLSWRRSISYRNQSIDLLCKSIDWFLYDRDHCDKRDDAEESEPLLTQFLRSYNTLNTFYKSVNNPSGIDLVVTNSPDSSQNP